MKEMEKKVYVQPLTTVVEMEVEQIIATSQEVEEVETASWEEAYW